MNEKLWKVKMERWLTDGKSPEEIAWELQVLLGRFHVRGMASDKHPGYDVCVEIGGIDQLGEMFTARGLRGPVAVVTDANVGALYLSRVTEALTKSGFKTTVS